MTRGRAARLGRGVAALLVAALVTGCGGAGADRSTTPLLIGTSLPLTGADSQTGVAVEQGYRAWEKVINASGGILGRQVAFKILDDADDQNTVISDYNALIERYRADFVVGTFSSRLTIPASTVAERHRKLYLNPAGGARQVFERGNRLLFYTEPAAPWEFGTPFARYLANLPADQRPRTAAYVLTQDPFTSTTVEAIKPILEAAGVATVVNETYPMGTQNFDPIAAQVKQSGAQVVIDAGGFEDETALVRALMKAGATPRFLYQTNAPAFLKEYPAAIGAANAEGVFYPAGYNVELNSRDNPAFVAAFRELYHTDPSGLAAYAFAAGQVLTAALTAVGEEGVKDQRKLADWLRANSVDTVAGKLSWDAKGISQGVVATGQWQGGRTRIILPPELAQTTTVRACWRAC
ncbi:amino acid ABC transporter substrate-binding protein [Pseudonocardia acaciae]|uniref:amino acid ABC transporter substrate-binding protein n=1 Tax=Pseudonocardia acaciae TaxID=551276 RepID=UPI0006874549|nr:amino acid ABC transporter substrate-binding protein [Pseudonocardia acaciae]